MRKDIIMQGRSEYHKAECLENKRASSFGWLRSLANFSNSANVGTGVSSTEGWAAAGAGDAAGDAAAGAAGCEWCGCAAGGTTLKVLLGVWFCDALDALGVVFFGCRKRDVRTERYKQSG